MLDSVVEYQGLESILFASIKESILVSSCCCSIAQGCPSPPALLSLLSRPPFSHRPPPPLPLLSTGGTETWAESYKAETWKLYLGKTGPRPLFSALCIVRLTHAGDYCDDTDNRVAGHSRANNDSLDILSHESTSNNYLPLWWSFCNYWLWLFGIARVSAHIESCQKDKYESIS